MKKLTTPTGVYGPFHSITIETDHYRADGCVMHFTVLGYGGVVSDALPEDFPAPVQSKASRWEEIKALRDQKIQQGGYQVAGKWFHSDTFSRTQQIGLVIMGAGIPSGLQWKTMDGSFVTMTQTLASQVFAAAAAQDAALFAHAESLRAEVYASQSPETIDITAGWPATFTG